MCLFRSVSLASTFSRVYQTRVCVSVCLCTLLFSACRLSLLFPAFCCTVSISPSISSTFSCSFFPLLLRQAAAAFSPAGNGATVIALDSTQTDKLQSVHSRDGESNHSNYQVIIEQVTNWSVPSAALDWTGLDCTQWLMLLFYTLWMVSID